MWADELAAFAVSTVVTGDFSLSGLVGPGFYPLYGLPRLALAFFGQILHWPDPDLDWLQSVSLPLLPNQERPPFLCPAWQDLFSSDQLLAPFLCGRHDFKITNNVRLSPRLCSTQRVSRKDHSDRSSGGVTLVTSVDPVSCATFRKVFL